MDALFAVYFPAKPIPIVTISNAAHVIVAETKRCMVGNIDCCDDRKAHERVKHK